MKIKTGNTQAIIDILKEDGADSYQSMIDALNDGEYLAKKKWSQLEIEYACGDIQELLMNSLTQ